MTNITKVELDAVTKLATITLSQTTNVITQTDPTTGAHMVYVDTTTGTSTNSIQVPFSSFPNIIDVYDGDPPVGLPTVGKRKMKVSTEN